ncbi:MAG: SDR family NAD(P)-dependent oxidoreductase, partial [Acidobacteriota bacterium]|nr:SDR family NAD(P)-dependent oxidoreductase [Acidobacteriota bacterium]
MLESKTIGIQYISSWHSFCINGLLQTPEGKFNKVGNKNKNGLWLATAVGVGAVTAYGILRRAHPKYDFQNKVVLITGGSRGLGLVLARSLAAEGARLAICARDDEELKRAKEDLQSHGAEVLETVCDVRNQSEVNSAVDAVCNHYGQIDVLINNAGVIQVAPLENQTQKDFEDAMAIHFWGAFYMTQAVLPEMKRRGDGRIVNISSIGGKIPVPHLAPYCASKFALVGLSGAMRAELVKDNIYVTTVCPGLMRTGSPVNAIFKGQNEKEYAWFSICDSLPFTSVSAENAAEQIINACRRGDAELVISPQAKLAAKIGALFPELTADALAIANKFLPSAGGIGEKHALGKDST